MTAEYEEFRIESDDFTRRFAMRGQNLMWFLGAGASASAGVPTALNMVWDFKRQLFITQTKVAPQAISDLSNPAVRTRIQDHINASGRFPLPGAPNEYAILFEEVYPVEADRRRYLDEKLLGAKPSFGHLALATLMRAGRSQLVWTTNFDTLIADACARVYDTTGALTTVDLDAPSLAIQSIQEGRWPVEVKLHGDFRSLSLKNTTAELHSQDVQLRQMLVNSCRRFGLLLVGYSGRDDSVMDALEEALAAPDAFPAGLFWLHRGDDVPFNRVTSLLSQARSAQVEGGLVQIENFDETLRDLVRPIQDMDTSALDSFGKERQVWSGAPVPGGKKGWPVIRLNALPIVEAPVVCRRVVCGIGGTAEVREAIKGAGANVIAVRSKAGVLAFGSDEAIRAAFGPFVIEDFDVHTLDTRRRTYDSTERGFLREALAAALVRHIGMEVTRRHSTDLLTPADPTATTWSRLRTIIGEISGEVPGKPGVTWCEGVSLRLDWANDRLWLLFEPRTVFSGSEESNRFVEADFAKKRAIGRYNSNLNELLDFWASCLAQGEREIRALGIENGIDATFRISPNTGFSRRTAV